MGAHGEGSIKLAAEARRAVDQNIVVLLYEFTQILARVQCVYKREAGFDLTEIVVVL